MADSDGNLANLMVTCAADTTFLSAFLNVEVVPFLNYQGFEYAARICLSVVFSLFCQRTVESFYVALCLTKQ